MTHPTDFTLSAALRMFLGEYLPHQKAYSIHTILSYRDSLKLLLQFAAGERGRVCDLSIKSLDLATIRAFLESLETKRHNGPATRNVRLGAIHSFFQFLCREFPEYLDQAQHVLGIPFKRTSSRIIDYLDADEIHALLEHIDRSTRRAKRLRAAGTDVQYGCSGAGNRVAPDNRCQDDNACKCDVFRQRAQRTDLPAVARNSQPRKRIFPSVRLCCA